MKTVKLCFWVLAFVPAASPAFAQGTVNFNNHTPGKLVTLVYSQETNLTALVTGNGSNDTPSGTTVYTGTSLGGTSDGTYAGQNFTAQLWALTGTGQPASALQAVTQYTTTFLTQSSGAGFFILANPSPDPGIPNTSAGAATLQLRVWDNRGGTVTDWATAASDNLHMRGLSPTFDLTNLGVVTSPVAPNLTGLVSFSLSGPLSVPEPSTLALITLGGIWLGLLRRRSSSRE